MSLAVSCAIIGIALVATTVAVTVVLGGDMLRREWLRKRRWKRLERSVILRAQPEESPGRPGDPSTPLRSAQDDRETGERIATASVSTGLAMTEEETE